MICVVGTEVVVESRGTKVVREPNVVVEDIVEGAEVVWL